MVFWPGRSGRLPPSLRLDDITRPADTFVFIEQSTPNVGGGGEALRHPHLYPQYYLSLGAWPGENHHRQQGLRGGHGDLLRRRTRRFWEYSDPRTGNLVESTWGGLLNGTPVIDAQGRKTYPSAYNPNSPDIYQLEAWSGGPVPPDVRPLGDPVHPGS